MKNNEIKVEAYLHHYLVAYSAAWSACTDQAAYMWKNVIVTIEFMKALLMKATINNIKKTFIWLKKNLNRRSYFDRIPISMFWFQTPVSIFQLILHVLVLFHRQGTSGSEKRPISPFVLTWIFCSMNIYG